MYYIAHSELTVDLTKYLQNCATKLCSKSKSVSELLLILKPVNDETSSTGTTLDGQNNAAEQMDVTADDSGRKSSISGSCELSEATKWSYCTQLTDWLYHVS